MELQWKTVEPLLDCLHGVQQNPVYHGEGDVYRHTRLVMEELQAMPSYRALDNEAREQMLLAAALHDLGKKPCTRMREGRWISPHHGSTGAGMARAWMMTQTVLSGTPERLAEREALCALVYAHMKPLYVFEAEDPGRKVRRMAAAGELVPGFTLEKLAMLAEADNRGRVCSDKQDRLDLIDRFRELAERLDCYRKPFSYPDAASRYADLSGRKAGSRGAWGTVILLCGLPGTGKDTFAAKEYGYLPMVSPDDIRRSLGLRPGENPARVEQEAQKSARALLRTRQSFLFNANNLTRAERKPWISLCHQFGAAVRILYLETGWQERRRRSALKAAQVSEEDLLDQLTRFSPPACTEAEEVEWICV